MDITIMKVIHLKVGSQSNGGKVCLKARKYTDICAIARTKAGSGKVEPEKMEKADL